MAAADACEVRKQCTEAGNDNAANMQSIGTINYKKSNLLCGEIIKTGDDAHFRSRPLKHGHEHANNWKVSFTDK
jgi:hypothetical protein